MDRVMYAVLTNDFRNEIELDGARMLSFAINDCQASHIFGETEQYRCDHQEGQFADLIARPSELWSLPDNSFDVVAVSSVFAGYDEPESALREFHRVIRPGGWIIAPEPEIQDEEEDLAGRLKHNFSVWSVSGFDPVTRANLTLHLGQKTALSLDSQSDPPSELTGYAYHLSRKTGRRIVFCLDGPLSPGDQLPIQTINGKTVGHVRIGPYTGGRAAPPESWSEGFRLPPRAVFDLDSSLGSGVYSLDGKIPFVHRRNTPASVAVLIPSHTATAFNDAGGRSLYDTPEAASADVLSFHRPVKPLVLLERTWPFLRWFAAANPFPEETTYLVDADLEDSNSLEGIEVLVVIGRSEYWTRGMRENFDTFVNQGGRALLLCSELMYWQVRVEWSRHQLLRYKDVDPHPDPLLRTTVWHHPSLEYPIYPRTGCEFRYGGSSDDSNGVGWGGMRVVCPDSPLLVDTDLKRNDLLRLPDASVWDGAPATLDDDGVPRIDFGESPPWRHEVVGYNFVKPAVSELPPGRPAVSLWVVLRRTPSSGTVIHCGTMGWCGPCAIAANDSNSDRIRSVILRMLAVLAEDAWPFSSVKKMA